MSNSESIDTIHNIYNKREDKNYWGAYMLNKESYSLSLISTVFGIPKFTV